MKQKRIKFLNNDVNQKNFAREIRLRVEAYFTDNKLSVNGDYKMYIKTAVLLCLYLSPFIIVLTTPLPAWLAILMTVISGMGAAGIGMSVMHDGAHGSYSSIKWVNDLAASSMLLLGSITFSWKVQHNLQHHTFTNVHDYDPDISTKAVIRLCEHAPLKKYQKLQQFYSFFLYGLMTFLQFFGEVGGLLRSKRMGLINDQRVNFKLEIAKLITTKIIYLLIIFGLPLLLTNYNFWQILLGFVIMQVTAGMILSIVFQLAHVVEGVDQILPDENSIIHSEWAVHQMRTTSDFGRKNGILSWYIGGLDYQVEHHLFPYMCHIHYPSIAPIVEATAKEFGITYHSKPSFFHALASHYRKLRELGREKK